MLVARHFQEKWGLSFTKNYNFVGFFVVLYKYDIKARPCFGHNGNKFTYAVKNMVSEDVSAKFFSFYIINMKKNGGLYVQAAGCCQPLKKCLQICYK